MTETLQAAVRAVPNIARPGLFLMEAPTCVAPASGVLGRERYLKRKSWTEVSESVRHRICEQASYKFYSIAYWLFVRGQECVLCYFVSG